MKKLLLVCAMVLVLSLVSGSVCGGTSDEAKIEDEIEDAVSEYNKDMPEEAQVTVKDIDVEVDGSTAVATVKLEFMGEEMTVPVTLNKKGDEWVPEDMGLE